MSFRSPWLACLEHYNDVTWACMTLHWRHNEHDGVSNHQPHDWLLDRLFRCGAKKASKLRGTGLCAGNWPVTDEFPAQRTRNAENVFIWWRHHELKYTLTIHRTCQAGLVLRDKLFFKLLWTRFFYNISLNKCAEMLCRVLWCFHGTFCVPFVSY